MKRKKYISALRIRILYLLIIVLSAAAVAGCAGNPADVEERGTEQSSAGSASGDEGDAVEPASERDMESADASQEDSKGARVSDDGTERGITGTWQGHIIAGSSRIKTILHLEQKEGLYSAAVDSPEQGAMGIPVETVTIEGQSIILELPAVSARYEGRIVSEETGTIKIEGMWIQGGGRFPLDFEPADSEAVNRRAQDPRPPFPYVSEDVTFRNEDAGITLAGTVTRPEGAGPFPSVVLVSGSGPQDRNEEVFNHRPFLVLADHLSRNGVAVLRYDDRGVGGSGGDGSFDAASSADLAGDAAAAFDFLLQQDYSDDSCSGMLGHSEGGVITGSLAAARSDIGFVIFLASPAVPGDELLVMQSAAMQRAMGMNESIVEMSKKANREIYSIVKTTADDKAAARKIRTVLKGLGMGDDQIEEQIKVLISRWYRHFLSYDPREDFREISCPVLALYGSKDVQVPAQENAAEMREALESGPVDRYTVKTLDGLNHMFQHAESGTVQEYGTLEETFAPEALTEVSSWISNQCSAR